MSVMNQVTEGESADWQWSWLYKTAGTAALITVVLIPIQIAVFMAWPPPGFEPTSSTVIGFFTLFQKNRLIGLLDQDLLLVVDEVLGIPIALALYIALRRANQAFMLIATALGLVGSAAYLASNTAFAMHSLSAQYAAAATDAQRALLVAAGQAVLANYTGTSFQANYVLGSAALIITSAVILKSNIFSKLTGYVGILASLIALGLYVPKIGLALSILSVPLFAIWNTLIARRFFHLSRRFPESRDSAL